MAENDMQAMRQSSMLAGGNVSYLEALYEQYISGAELSEDWQAYFSTLPKLDGIEFDVSHDVIKQYFKDLVRQQSASTIKVSHDGTIVRQQAKVAHLINAFRSYGHHHADLDPLGLAQRKSIQDLSLQYHGLSEADLDTLFNAEGFAGLGNTTLKKLYQTLQQKYCDTIGIEFMHISDTNEVDWIIDYFENKPRHCSKEEKHAILEQLTAAEGLEKYLGTRYVGQKRFSLEGADSLIPALHTLIQSAAGHQVQEVVLGMAHRGRLNVLINVLGKAPEELFLEFEGKKHIDEALSSGDVKYHMGFSSDVETPAGELHLTLAFNPSHLEIINPVVEGSVRARQRRRQDAERRQVVPVLIHGDAAFAGQGVVMETFSLSQARGFCTGGTVHFIINNQIGFTTSNPLDSRSTLYCTDIAKMVQAPVLHVNADDPEAVAFVTKLALDYRMRFKKDVVVDLVCYRRHGHNEADEPTMTQPVMYQAIKNRPTIRSLYAEKLMHDGLIESTEAEERVTAFRTMLDAGNKVTKTIIGSYTNQSADTWKAYLGKTWQEPADTTLSAERIQELSEKLYTVPEGFTLQPRVAKTVAERLKMGRGEVPLDWGYAETMAYAGLLTESTPHMVRLCGQDVCRGTFSHRHAVWHDYKTGDIHIPLEHLSQEQAQLSIIDSVLSEEAVLAFEYGFATTDPEALVIWEAQFGDFANGAQVVFDQFISSGQQKWGRLCGLTLLLPHGYEGQGPEHSSARLERHLQLCAQHNMQVCVPSTPGQIFHLLRRQVLRPFRTPLIIMSPKSLLRHPLATSSLDDLMHGQFTTVIPEIDDIPADKVERVVLCSGKVYYDLLKTRRDAGLDNVAILRIEQLYPFPQDELKRQLATYKNFKQLVWCQEEPKNQGAWYSTRHRFEILTQKGQELFYAGRTMSASPAAGSAGLHNKQQTELVNRALNCAG